MLVSLVIHVRPVEPARVPHFLGGAVQAWFLDQVRQRNAALADELHDSQGLRPYTASRVVGLGEGSPEGVFVHPERPGWLRITSLRADVSALLRERIAPSLPGQVIDVPGARLRIERTTADPAEHPWAGTDTYPALLQRHTLTPEWPPRRLGLAFASPTVFKSNGQYVPFPMPALVFGSLLDRWAAHSPVAIHPEMRRFAAECIVASRYRLRTAALSVDGADKGVVVGFTGDCHYAIRSSDRFWGGLAHLLAGYAFYAGVGARTAVGLGQTRPWHHARPDA